MSLSFISQSPEDTFALGMQLGALIETPILITLDGDLGAGKTHFVQGLAKGLDILDIPRSPTFSIMEEYKGRVLLLHVDLYRLEEEDLEPLGLEEQLEDWEGVIAVEWAKKFPHILPIEPLAIHIQHNGELRHVHFSGVEHRDLLKNLEKRCAFLS